MKPEPKLLIALESIPHVIGERQFRMLCEALEIDELLFVDKDYKSLGMTRDEYFAHCVQVKSINSIDRRRREATKPSHQPYEGS
ncbi:hypothetical protein BiPBO1_71 [Brucella phage BiPBO1]|uniref:hypothetical protein n=1 Tax=Brucella phage BiPBO1 TaxID=1718278 RepID=UPI00078BEB17|nr:hypothetical protein BJD47_gp71 [Brucella phage BiPBO1]ALJ98285.1 hypothetical protein BiPBO1_71 [Brucella phage BiPBO1]